MVHTSIEQETLGNLKMHIIPRHDWVMFSRKRLEEKGMQESKSLFMAVLSLHYITLHSITLHYITVEYMTLD